MPTVSIEHISANLLLMHWDHQPHPNDINQAFNDLIDYLNTSTVPVHVVVDIRSNPRFPTHLTVQRAYVANRHPLMGDWLVVGTSITARLISRMIATIHRDNIRWFDTREAAYDSIRDGTAV